KNHKWLRRWPVRSVADAMSICRSSHRTDDQEVAQASSSQPTAGDDYMHAERRPGCCLAFFLRPQPAHPPSRSLVNRSVTATLRSVDETLKRYPKCPWTASLPAKSTGNRGPPGKLVDHASKTLDCRTNHERKV